MGFGLSDQASKAFRAKVVLDILLVLLDVFFDYALVKDLLSDGHYRWAVAALCVTMLPGITSSIALRAEAPPKDLRGNLKYLTILFFYPFWICWLGWRTVQEPSNLHMMVHLKSYEGLMEAAFQFLIQIIIFFSRTAVGHIKVFGLHIPNGDFWWRNFNIFLSLMSFTWGVCNYHQLLDKNLSGRSALKVMPYFLVNFLFRTITIALFFVYIKLPYIIFVYVGFLMLGLANMYLTHRTMLATKEHCSHWIFTCIIGGIISILTPAQGSFYGEGVKGSTVRKYYKANTILTNIVLGLSFTSLAIYLNVTPETGQLHRFPLLSCHSPNHSWKLAEFGFYDKKYENCTFDIKIDFPLLGGEWEVRGKEKLCKDPTVSTTTTSSLSISPANVSTTTTHPISPSPSSGNTSLSTSKSIPTTQVPIKQTKPNHPPSQSSSPSLRNSTFRQSRSFSTIPVPIKITKTKLADAYTNDTTFYLVSQECKKDQKDIDNFNMIIIPLVVALGILSTISAFSMKKWNIEYQHEVIEQTVDY